MTPEEIMYAFEIFREEAKRNGTVVIANVFLNDISNFINQLKKDNENYSHNIKQLTSDHRLLQHDYNHIKELWANTQLKLEKEREKLVVVCKKLQSSRELNKDIMQTVAYVRENSIKEFVDFIVEELCIGRGDDRSELYVCEDDIRDLIKRFLDGENIETQKETETGK